MDNNRQQIPPVALVVLAVLLWSTGGLFIKLTTLDAYQVTFFRSLLAGITVLMVTRKSGLKINLFGIIASLIYATLLFLFVWATKHTTAANAIFLQYTAPIYILIFAPFLIGEKFHWRDLVTILLCIGGMSLFFVGKLELSDYEGNLAALASGVFLGLYILLLKHPKAIGSKKSRVVSQDSEAAIRPPANVLSENIPPVQEGLAGATADGVGLSIRDEPTKVGTQNLNPVITVIYGNFLLAVVTLPSGIAAIPTITISDFAAVAWLGIFQIGIAYILFIKGVHGGTRPLDASIIGFIEPLLNPVWVFLFVGERPSQWAILGGSIIIITVIAHTLNQYRTRPIIG